MTASKLPQLLQPSEDGKRYELISPTVMPSAGGFLWNQRMMIQATCRGYATAQFMQPEPAKYSYAPNVEAKTFMQPEPNYYSHHPGRFCYVKDEESGNLFSAPYEPVRAELESFVYSVGTSDIRWQADFDGLRVEMTLVLPTHDVAELWTVRVVNISDRARRVSVYPHFTIGYMSWMNQSAKWSPELGGIVATCVTPYQKASDWEKNKLQKDKTYFLCETAPVAWEARHSAFEGEGGLHAPSAVVQLQQLSNSDAVYESPTAVVQYREKLDPNDQREYRFMFGPAYDDVEIQDMRQRYLSEDAFVRSKREYESYIEKGRGCLINIKTPDDALNNFLNNWLARQVYYHGDVNRLSTDPQTRNYLQDNMGMSYINPAVARRAFLTALSQQEATGAMPDGIILAEGAELKYINQIPHTDHCVWLPVTLEVYLSETADYALLDEQVTTKADGKTLTVFERFCAAMDWLLCDKARDKRGLSYIAQGDWCDPMNQVGIKGKGVSGWLTIATGLALNIWADVCEQRNNEELARRYRKGADDVNEAANKYFWTGEWYARGITDDNVTFGVPSDKQGRIWLNPQSFAMLGGAAPKSDRARRETILRQVDEQLATPYGVQMFAPAFTGMREDIGRITQKAPGSAENAAVYNHAAIFFIHALYTAGETERAFKYLRQMIPGSNQFDSFDRGQLPIYIPNYYRGAWREQPRTAGRSSQLFNTGTIAWVYRCVVEGLCGLRGDAKGLAVNPQLPAQWDEMDVTREFRGATFDISIRRDPGVEKVTVRRGERGEELLPEAHVDGQDIKAGETYRLFVTVP